MDPRKIQEALERGLEARATLGSKAFRDAVTAAVDSLLETILAVDLESPTAGHQLIVAAARAQAMRHVQTALMLELAKEKTARDKAEQLKRETEAHE